MKRKLVQHGLSSLITTLPSGWINGNNLKKGDEIDIVEEDNSLIIRADYKENKKSIILDMRNKNFLKRYINSAYILGYDEIQIINVSINDLSEIKKSVSELIGYEIIDQKDKTIVIQALSGENKDLDNIVRRIFHLLNSISKDICNSGETEIIELDSLINKLRFFSSRQINKIGYRSRSYDTYTYLQLSRVEEACDEYKALSKLISKKKELKEELRSICNRISEYIVLITNEYFKPTISNLPDIKKNREYILNLISKSVKRSNNPELYLHLYSIMHILRHIEGTILYEDTAFQKE